MDMFLGAIIEESLQDPAVLAGWHSIARRVAEMPEDPHASVWHVNWYAVPEAALVERLPALAAAMRPHWYGHFWAGDDLCVILAGRVFWAKAAEVDTWRPFIAYGDTVGVERKWTETIPTLLPAYVEAVWDGQTASA